MRKATSWGLQICRIEDKGVFAGRQGLAKTSNPYLAGYRNQNGRGGGLQRQRRLAWDRGWERGAKEPEATQ